ncbi:hypothetical protein DRQ50_11075 [bacterium]|nr:MAG: hypothetical protein DRQ50_11075 [bacterium]
MLKNDRKKNHGLTKGTFPDQFRGQHSVGSTSRNNLIRDRNSWSTGDQPDIQIQICEIALHFSRIITGELKLVFPLELENEGVLRCRFGMARCWHKKY